MLSFWKSKGLALILNAQENLSAQEKKEKKNPRISQTVTDCWRPPRAPKTQAKRQKKAFGLSKLLAVGFWILVLLAFARSKSHDLKAIPLLAKKFRLAIGQSPISKQKSHRGNYFAFKKMENDLAYGRFGVVVSAKVDKNSTGRNRIRRLVFNFVKDQKLHLRPGLDSLIISRKKFATADKQAAQNELEKFLT